MKLNSVIIDADFCIKIGASDRYHYLERVLMELADRVYIHEVVYREILSPVCAKKQLDCLKDQGIVVLLHEKELSPTELLVYQNTYQLLKGAMINPRNPRKNNGEVSSLAMAKTKSIPYFATDEKDLQPIINKHINNGIDDVTCIRIKDIILKIKAGEISGFTRKEAKVLWRLSGKSTEIFDRDIWPAV